MNKSILNIKIFFDLILSLFINKFIGMWRIFVFENKKKHLPRQLTKVNVTTGAARVLVKLFLYTTSTESFFFLINIEDFNITIRKMRWLKYEGCVIFCCFRHKEPPPNNNIGIKTNKFVN